MSSANNIAQLDVLRQCLKTSNWAMSFADGTNLSCDVLTSREIEAKLYEDLKEHSDG